MPRNQEEQPKGTPARATASTQLEFLPAATQRAIEEEVEHGFFERARRLLTDLSWGRYRNQVHGPILAFREFTAQYTDLLAWAFAEYIGLVAKAAVNLRVRVPWHKADSAAFYFLDRFVTGAYHQPWAGDFLLGRSVAAYRTLHEVAPWFNIEVVTPDIWERVFFEEVRSGPWRARAIEEGKRQVELKAAVEAPQRSARRNSKQEAATDVPPWDALKKRKSISQGYAAELLRCDARTIRNRFRARRLTKTPSKRVACDDKLLTELRKQHGKHYR